MVFKLVFCNNENDVSAILAAHTSRTSWMPLGENENNYGYFIQNQQSSPIAASIEKLTNSIGCYFDETMPRVRSKPKVIICTQLNAGSKETFFAKEWKHWHLSSMRRSQAMSIQILVSGSRTKPCLAIYDDGEGQHPGDFERTFLSLCVEIKTKSSL